MSVITKLRSLTGQAQYEYYAEVLRRAIATKNYFPVPFQYSDWRFLDEHKAACLCRAPGGSKTLDTVNWIILQKILHPEWAVAWLAAIGGHLTQARIWFENHIFVKQIKHVHGYERIYLWNGTYIHFRSASKGIAGLRLDLVVIDEEELLEPQQVEIVYPQIKSRLTASSIGKFIHLGTMQTGTLFQSNTENYPTRKTIWEDCPWLVAAGFIQQEIDDKIMPRHEIDMLFYCIPSSPGGAILPRLEKGEVPADVLGRAGTDHGNKDVAVITYEKDNILYVIGEYERVLLDDHSAFDFLRDLTTSIEAEGGGYNDDAKYDAKASLLTQRVGAHKQAWTKKWAQRRLMKARTYTKIVVDPLLTPRTWKDLKNGRYDPNNGNIWYKHSTRAPCHWLDAFFHSVHVATPLITVYERPIISIHDNSKHISML